MRVFPQCQYRFLRSLDLYYSLWTSHRPDDFKLSSEYALENQCCQGLECSLDNTVRCSWLVQAGCLNNYGLFTGIMLDCELSYWVHKIENIWSHKSIYGQLKIMGDRFKNVRSVEWTSSNTKTYSGWGEKAMQWLENLHSVSEYHCSYAVVEKNTAFTFDSTSSRSIRSSRRNFSSPF